MNILVVDDEKEIADVIALYLQSDQYTVYPFLYRRRSVGMYEDDKDRSCNPRCHASGD